MNEDTKATRGGAGRGQGRKPIAADGDQAIYKLRMTQDQRSKLDQLGGAAWVRAQIDAAADAVSPVPPSL